MSGGSKPKEDPAIAAALTYERATRQALKALNARDVEAQRQACRTYAEAATALQALSIADYNRGLTWLKSRARIPHGAAQAINEWSKILLRLEATSNTEGDDECQRISYEDAVKMGLVKP